MSNRPAPESSIDNAEEIIERFGGIRPMAQKLGAAVTTVQGWKKRGSIPPHRIAKIIAAAQKHDVDLSDLIELPEPSQPTPSLPAPQAHPDQVPEDMQNDNKNQGKTEKTEEAEEAEEVKESEDNTALQPPAYPPPAPRHLDTSETTLHDNLVYSIAQAERRAVKKSTMNSLILVVIATIALALIFGLQSGGKSEAQRKAELAALQDEMQALKAEVEQNKQAKNTLMDNAREQVAVLKNSAEDIKKNAAALANEAKAISEDLISGNSEAVLAQMVALEKQFDALGEFPMMASITQRFAGFTSTVGGQTLLEQSTDELASALTSLKNAKDETIEQQIDQARQQSVALQQSLEDVPQSDLKAAAMLLTMTQLRSTLNRNGEPFEEDLSLLQSLVGEDDPELISAIQKLAPHAQSGVLTTTGLSNELKSLTGEIVVASLKGEELDIKERAKARMDSVLLLNQKDGQITPSTQTQDTLLQADEMLKTGDLEGAITMMQSLNGPAAKAAAPWIDEAQASLIARQLKAALSGVLDAKAAGLKSYGSGSTYSSGGKLQPIYLTP